MPHIYLKNVSKVYRRQLSPAVYSINLTIKQGEFVFVTGSTGSGKSTLLKLISGETFPTDGTVLINRLKINRFYLKSRWLRTCVGYVPQVSGIDHKKTVGENLMEAAVPGFSGPSVMEMVKKSLKLVGLFGAESMYPSQLSYIDCRWLELACALINSPPILVIDELMENVDKDSFGDMMHLLEKLNRMGYTVVMATYAKQYVYTLRKRVITLKYGRIQYDSL